MKLLLNFIWFIINKEKNKFNKFCFNYSIVVYFLENFKNF